MTNYVHLNGGWSPVDKRLGGSEEMVVETAKRLAKQHEVVVYHNGTHGIFDGVAYKAHEEFEEPDVVINLNAPEFDCRAPQIFWTSLAKRVDTSKFAAVCCISEFALNYAEIVHPNVFIIPPGYDPNKIKPGDKIPKQCFYASSPDRGLDVLLKAWPTVYERNPDATLILTYGAKTDLPGVICLGDVDEDTMNEIYATSDVWCHPCTGIELFCMTGAKAQVAQCIPVVIPHMALMETVKTGYFTCEHDYADTLSAVLSHDYKEASKNRRGSANGFDTWDKTTTKLLKVINLITGSQDKQ